MKMNPKKSLTKIKDSLRENIRKVFIQELYIEGEEPPKSYFGERKFFGLYAIFLIYSFLVLIGINFPGTYLNILTFGNPFVFGNALVAFYLTLSILFSIDKLDYSFLKNIQRSNR